MSHPNRRPRWVVYYSILFAVLFCVLLAMFGFARGPHVSLQLLFAISAGVALVITLVWMAMRPLFVAALKKSGTNV